VKKKYVLIGEAEEEYFRRELKFDVLPKKFVDKNRLLELMDEKVAITIQIGGDPDELNIFKGLPANSVNVLLYADEVYDVRINRRILKYKSVKTVYRVYPIWKTNLGKLFLTFFFNPNQGFGFVKEFGLKKTLIFKLIGIEMFRRQFLIKIYEKYYGKKSKNIPLGYTDTFAKNYIKLVKNKYNINIDGKQSLIEVAIDNLHLLQKEKSLDFFFVGQKGNLERQFAIKKLEKVKNSEIYLNERFNEKRVRNSQRDFDFYVENGIRSKRILCPPGNYSALTFRLLESLCLGSLPVRASSCITDPLYPGPLLPSGSKVFSRSWAWTIQSASELSDKSIQILVENELTEKRNLFSLLVSGFSEFSNNRV
jgi:hypothetical protein